MNTEAEAERSEDTSASADSISEVAASVSLVSDSWWARLLMLLRISLCFFCSTNSCSLCFTSLFLAGLHSASGAVLQPTASSSLLCWSRYSSRCFFRAFSWLSSSSCFCRLNCWVRRSCSAA